MPEPVENVPNFDEVMCLVNEQKAVINALNDKIKTLEQRTGASEEKLTALASQRTETITAVSAVKSELDKAYDKTLEELGIKKKD